MNLGCLVFSAAALLAPIALAQDGTPLELSYGTHPTQRLTLALPEAKEKPSPLLIFVPGGFWGALDERFVRLAENNTRLSASGVAVALMQTRPTTAAPWPAAMEDVAAATVLLKRQAGRHRIDPRRIFLVGHSSGAFAALALALDATARKRADLAADDIAGVVALSGIFDLAGPAHQGRVAEFVDAAFKATKPKLDTSAKLKAPIMILTGERDLDGLVRDAQSFARRLHATGHAVTFQIVPGANHQTMANIAAQENRLVRELVLDLLGVAPKPEELQLLVKANQHLFFRTATASESFWKTHAGLIRPYPVDDVFLNFLGAQIQDHRYQLAGLPFKIFHAIALADLVKTLPGKGAWLITVNARQERYHWRIADMLQYDPLVVVGIDDEKDLFRYGVPYRNKREYSWVDREQPMASAYRALGGMLFFRKRPPRELLPQIAVGMSLTPQSFSLGEHGPLHAFPDLPEPLKPVMTHVNGCISCHTLRGVGSLAHHIRIDDGSKQGGLALPLEHYAPEVWNRFVFDQPRAAAMVGVTANMIAEAARSPLHDYVNKVRAEKPRK